MDIHSTDTIKHFPDVLQQMDMLVIRPQNYDLAAEDGIKLRINLNKYSLLDFDKADEIYSIGYKHGLAMVDSIKNASWHGARRPRSRNGAAGSRKPPRVHISTR